MAKNNIRSVRFSDEMVEIINQQIGDNFTQKFERMVYNCYMLLPEKERQLRDMEERYQKEKERYLSLSRRCAAACCCCVTICFRTRRKNVPAL